MKKILFMLITVLALSASVSFAVPAAPVFSNPVKVGEGHMSSELHKKMVFSGESLYVGIGAEGTAAKVFKSDNGGKDWSLAKVLQTTTGQLAVDAASLRLAVSDDPQKKGSSVIHAAWHVTDEKNGRQKINYSYFLERSPKSGWSTPVTIDVGTPAIAGTSLVVTSKGEIHILFGNKYTTAAALGAAFSEPIEFAEASGGETFMLKDQADNLYVAYVNNDRKLVMAKKGASSKTWSPAVAVYSHPKGSLSRNFDLEVLDTSTYYVGYYSNLPHAPGFGEVGILVTTDGGNTWTKRPVLVKTPAGDNMVNLTVSAKKVITFASEVYEPDGQKSTVKVWRSSDYGATWSAPATIKGERLPNLLPDALGKTNILVMDETSNMTKAKILLIKEQ